MIQILELVLVSLPLQNLKDCRSVCQVWNQEITRFIKKLKAIKISKDDYSEADAILSSKGPYSSKILSQLQCKECCTSNDRFEKLIIFKGTFLHCMILEKCHLNVNSFLNLIWIDAFPNLSLLTLRQNEYVDRNGRHTVFIRDDENGGADSVFKCLKILEIDERGTDSQTTLENIAAMCPVLQKLTYSNCPIPSRIIRRESFVNLKNLDFLQLAPIDGRKMEHQHFEALVGLKLEKLKTLFLYGMTPGGKLRMKGLQNFLKSVSSTLVSLHLGQRILYHPEYQPRAVSPFPVVMPHLKRLSIGPGFVHSLKFLDKLPSVTSFTCNRMVAADWDKIVKKGVPETGSSQIGSLDLGDIADGPLSKLALAFPNLCRLELNASRIGNHDALLHVICSGLRKLQMFNIYDVGSQNLLTDTGITGISSSECSALKASRRRKIKPKRDFSYIGDLKCNLKYNLIAWYTSNYFTSLL